jgi:hypothetical protein
MPTELLRYQDGRITSTNAVAVVARALNPLGAAADIVATIGACVFEIGRFKSQAAELRVRHDVASQIIRTRQGVIIGLFEEQKRRGTSMYVDLEDIREGFRGMLRMSTNMGLSENERIAAQGTMVLLAQDMSKRHADAGRNLVRLSESLSLRDTEATITSWRALER